VGAGGEGEEVGLVTPDPLSSWPAFVAEASSRLERGRKDYGDRSFSLPPAELAREVEEELLDVAAWSFILWTRIRAIRGAVRSETDTMDTIPTMEVFPGGR